MADVSNCGSLEIEQFVHYYKLLTQRDEVLKVFQDFSTDGERLTMDELENFLRIEQLKEEGSSQYARQLIDRYEPSDSGGVEKTVCVSPTSVHFFFYLDQIHLIHRLWL